MKSLLKYASIASLVLTIFALTACGGQPNFDVTLEDGADLAVETDHLQITNQEMFELVGGGYLNWVNPGVTAIIDWADYIILSDSVEIDEERVADELEFIENFFDEDEASDMLAMQGFDSIDEYMVNVRLQMMREQAAYDEVEITEEAIQEAYEEWFAPAEEDAGDEGDAGVEDDTGDEADSTADDDEDTDDEDADDADSEADEDDDSDDDEDTDDEDDGDDDSDDDEDNEDSNDDEDTDDEDANDDDVEDDADENEIPELEDVREMIEDMLRNEILEEPGFDQGVLARLRAEAGLTIYSSYFATRYDDFISSWDISDGDLESGSNDSAIASVNDNYLTVDELFNTVVARFALGQQSPLLDYIDRNVLNEIYDVSNSTIRDIVNEEKRNMLEWFYPQMESRGLITEQQIFDFFLLTHLQDLAFEEEFLPLSEERLQDAYEAHIENLRETFEAENTPQRGARHILITEDEDEDFSNDDAREFAEELIEQLQDVDEDEVEDLFASLAEEYSSCPSSERGGDLGLFARGAMVPEFDEATFALDLYEFTDEPVETVHGFHIIYLYEIEEGADVGDLEIPTFEEARDTIIEEEEQRLRASPQYLASIMFELRADQNIRFHDEQLQSRYDSMIEQNRSIFDDIDDEDDLDDTDSDAEDDTDEIDEDDDVDDEGADESDEDESDEDESEDNEDE